MSSQNTSYPKVIFLGGAPMVGKSTIARLLAQWLNYDCLATDDIGAALAAITTQESHPALHYMGDLDYREYYIAHQLDRLVEDINRQHEALWPAIRTLFLNRSSWAAPAIIEGWAIRPAYVSQLPDSISGLFLLGDDALIESRTRASHFSQGASDPETMIQRYLERSLWYNALLRKQVNELGLNAIAVSSEMLPEEIADKCLQCLARNKEE